MERKEQGRGAVPPLKIAESQTKLDQSVDEDAVPLTPTASGVRASVQQAEPQVEISSSGDARYRAPPRSTPATSPRTAAQPHVSQPSRESSLTVQSAGNVVQETADPVVSGHPGDGAQGQLSMQTSSQPEAGEEDDDGGKGSGKGKGQDEDSLEKDVLKGISSAVNQRLERSIAPVDSEEDLKKPKPLTERDIPDADIEKYRLKFPDHLKTDYYDAMIIYENNVDTDEVQRFLKRARTEVLLNGKHKPLIILFDEIFPNAGMNAIKQLDDSLQYCTYVFLYVTKAFCVDGWTEFSSQTALMEAILTPDKRWSVVPIFTEPKRRPTYRVPPSVRSLKGIQYWSEDKFYADALRKLLEDKLEIRLKRAAKLKHERKLWIIEEKTRELKLEQKEKAELQLKEEEERRNQKINELAVQQHAQHQREMFKLKELHEIEQMRATFTSKSTNEDVKSLMLCLQEMSVSSRREAEERKGYRPGSPHPLPSSASEPTDLSELGERYAGVASYHHSASERPGHFPGYPPPFNYPGFPYHPGSTHNLPHYQSDPLLQYGSYPGYPGGPMNPGCHRPWAGSPGGYQDSGFGDGSPRTHYPPFSGYYGQVSSAHGAGPPFPGVRSLFPGQQTHRFSNPDSHSSPVQSFSAYDPHKSGLERGSAVQPSGVSKLFTSQEQSRMFPAGVESGDTGGQGASQIHSQEGECHSLPPGMGAESTSQVQPSDTRESAITDKAGFSSLPSELNVSSGDAICKSATSSSTSSGSLAFSEAATACRTDGKTIPTSQRQVVQPVSSRADSSEAVARDDSTSGNLPPQRKVSSGRDERQSSTGKDDLQVDYPSSTYQPGLSQVKSHASSYDSRQPQYSGAGQTSMYGPGSIAEHVMSTQGPGHSGSRTMHPSYQHRGMAPGPYGHPQYGPAPYHQYPGMPGPAPYPGHGYPPYSHAPPVPYSSQYYPPQYPPHSAAPPVYTESAPVPPATEVVHHHYHHDEGRERVPPVINIGKAENIMMGDRIEVNKKEKRRGRGQLEMPPPYEQEVTATEMPESYTEVPGQQFVQYVGEEFEGSGEMISRGGVISPQAASPSIPPFSQNPGSRLTAGVTADQSQGTSSYATQSSNENTEDPPPSTHSAYRDLPTTGCTSLEQATHQAGNTAMPMMTQNPDSWRQEFDAQRETCRKVPAGGDAGEYEPADDEEQTSVKKPL